jgi:chitodextrinase
MNEDDFKWSGYQMDGRTTLRIAILFIICALTVIVVTNLVSDDAEAWEDVTMTADSSKSGYAYKYVSSSSTYYYSYSSSTSNRVGWRGYRSSTSTYYYYYATWYQMPIFFQDNKTYIDSVNLRIRTSMYPIYHDVQAKFLSLDPTQGSGSTHARRVYDDIMSKSGTIIGTTRINSAGTYTFTFSVAAQSYLQNRINAGDLSVFIGLGLTAEPTISSGSYYRYQYVYPRDVQFFFKVDRSPPNQPSLNPLGTYTRGSSVTLRWSAVSDLPTGGSRGGVQYSVQAQEYNSGKWMTSYVTPWSGATSVTIGNLRDGARYRFQIMARDASDIRTGLSTPVYTTMDGGPPTTPVLLPLPAYTKGTSIDLQWWASTDAGIGMPTGPPGDYPYEVEWSTTPDFSTKSSKQTAQTTMTISGLSSNTLYYYRVRAQDLYNQWSHWSPIERSMQDDDPPMVPAMMDEPMFTKGTNNTIQWHPTVDAAVGVKDYWVQVSTDKDFGPGNITMDTNTTWTFVKAMNLTDGLCYYSRVAARDNFDHVSEWSEVVFSYQDDSGPVELTVHPLPEYSPKGAIELSWSGATDHGAGVGWYEVIVSLDPDFLVVEKTQDHIVGSSFQYVDVVAHDTTFYFRVTVFDLLGNEGEHQDLNTTMDIIEPEAPVIDPVPEFTRGTEITLSWAPVYDNGSGVDYYEVTVYSRHGTGLVFTGTTEQTRMTIFGLADRAMYWYQVRVVDRAGNENISALVSSTQDASPPTVPVLDPLPQFTPGTSVQLSWSASIDSGAAGIVYEVSWNLVGSPEDIRTVSENQDVIDGLTDGGTYELRVRAIDALGNTSPWSVPAVTTIDVSSPPVPTLIDPPAYSITTMLHLEWMAVEDGSGVPVEYHVEVFKDPSMEGTAFLTSPWITWNYFDVTGLTGGTTYYYHVIARDIVGWLSEPSEVGSTMVDLLPPEVDFDAGGMFGSTATVVSGTCSDAGSGIASVELSVDGGMTWTATTVNDGEWSMAIGLIPNDVNEVWVRATDAAGHVSQEPIRGIVDRVPPEIMISSPEEGDDVSGAVLVAGSISDPNLVRYTVEYQKKGDPTWAEIQSPQETTGMAGILATWVTAGLSGGDYILRITATDALDQTSEETVEVTLLGAILSIGASDITFSNPHPLPGETVTVLVTVRNDGDSPAENVIVAIYADGEKAGQRAGITVPPHGTAVVPVEIEAEGDQDITAKATSELYDTGDMDKGTPLTTIEEEAVLENAGGILGLIALIIAIVTLLVVFLMRRGGPAPDEEEPSSEEDIQALLELDEPEPIVPPTPPKEPPQPPQPPYPPMPGGPQSP